jgi:hypothetical protein
MRGIVKKIVQFASNFFEKLEIKKKSTTPIEINFKARSKSV